MLFKRNYLSRYKASRYLDKINKLFKRKDKEESPKETNSTPKEDLKDDK